MPQVFFLPAAIGTSKACLTNVAVWWEDMTFKIECLFFLVLAHACRLLVRFEILSAISLLVLLAIHKNWNRLILGVVSSIYWNTIGNLTVQICTVNHHQPSKSTNHHIGFLGLSRDNSQNYKIHDTGNYYSCPLIDTGGITHWFK